MLQVPSLNEVAHHHLRNHTLVRFRCMIQDMFDPEYYLGVFEVKKSNGDTALRCGMFRDTVECKVTWLTQIVLEKIVWFESTLCCVDWGEK